MTDRDESDTQVVPPRLDLTVRITQEYDTQEYEVFAGGKKRAYRDLRRATVEIVDINGVIVLTAAAVPDDQVPDAVATAIERWRVRP